MIVPCIDVQGGQVVQLVQGERLAVAVDDVDEVLERFADFPMIHAIDLDAAKGQGDNRALIQKIVQTRAGAVRVGGGIRSVDGALAWVEGGAAAVIVGSSAFTADGVHHEFATRLCDEVGRERVVLAMDCRAGRVATHGWRESTDLDPVRIVGDLTPYAERLLVTNVDREGTMQGVDLAFFARIREASRLPMIAAGGVGNLSDIQALLELGSDVAVGMAVYTGRISLKDLRRLSSD